MTTSQVKGDLVSEDWNDVPVVEVHARYLDEQGITPSAVLRHGIRSITKVDDLPPEFNHLKQSGDKLFPSLLFPWVEPDGTVLNQIKLPDELAKQLDSKYLWAKGSAASLGVIRHVEDPKASLIVEGTKQSIVAGIYAPEEYAVYGIAGCRMWSHEGVPTPHLAEFEDKNVIVMLDADAATNLEVYEAGVKLREALVGMYGADEVSFVRLPGGKTSGLDDLLGLQKPNARPRMMKRLIESVDRLTAAKKTKPADAKPNPKDRKPERPSEWTEDKRFNVITNGDAQTELRGIITGVKNKWDGEKIFNFGGVITRLKDGKTIPQSKHMWKSTVAEACCLLAANTKGEYSAVHPSTYAIDATYARAEDFTPLVGVKHAPFVRADGTICTGSGYDEGSKMFLHPSEDLKDVKVPEKPTVEQVREARAVIEEWLYDFRENVPSDADRANMIGLALTPFVRLLLPSCPLAIINGLQMGVGKNLLADGISIVYNGEKMVPNTLVLDEEEQRKQLTTTFQAGGDFFLFDESPYVGGKHLARALTAPVWTDRILGTNNTVEVPNQATMIVLGNNVRVEGDLQRRVYPINLRPKSPNPHLRRNDEFKHPDFLAYTRKNRRKILVALLTLVRAWFAAGQPNPKKPVTFGSFEVFEKTIGGILENAGIYGFLDNRTSFAQESSFEMRHWEEHLHWLHDTFGDGKFTAKQVQKAILEDPQNAETPPGMEDASGKGYTRQLGVEYSKIYERFIGGYRLVKDGTFRRATQWRVETIDGYTPPTDDKPKGDGGGNGGGNPPAPTAPVFDGGYALPFQPEYADSSVENLSVFDVLGAKFNGTSSNEDHVETDDNDLKPEGKVYETAEEMFEDLASEDPFATGDDDLMDEVKEYNSLVWDIESGDSNELFRWGKGEYLTVSGYQGDDDGNVVTDSGDEVVKAVTKSKRHFGFNSLGFDIPALAVHHDGDYLEMSENAVDLMLIERQINPTDAKGVKPGYYGLDQTARRYGHQGKTDDLNRLKTKYGSYHDIPRDELEPYLHGDLEATRFLADKIGHHYDEDPYIQREHEVMRRVNFGPRMHGFRLDLDELESRLHEGEQRKAANIARLHEEYGMPLGRWKKFVRKDDEWEAFKNPLASGPGKEWLEEILKELGATAMRRTDKSKEISTNKDDLKAAIEFYTTTDAATLRRKGINPDTLQRDRIKELCELIMAVTGERTVYQTIEAHRVNDRVHPSVSPDQASGRWSVKNPGLTVLGKRGGKHVERGVLLADPGEVLIAVDLDQVDARAIAAHCGDPEYMKLFEPGMDLHSTNAERAFGRSDGEWRDRAKILGHGFNYGLGPKGAAAQTGMDLEIAMRFHAMMKETYPRLEEWKNEIRALAENGYLLDNGFGRKMRCNPDRAYTQAPALVGQGATRDIIAQGILNLDMDLVGRIKVIVHDEIVFSLPESTWESDVERILRAMQFPIQFNNNPPMQITAGASEPGRSWADVYSN